MMTMTDSPNASAYLEREHTGPFAEGRQALGARGVRLRRIDEIVRDIHTAIEYGQVSERFANAVVRIRV